jgi:glucan 1,3-beta-glucosidase
MNLSPNVTDPAGHVPTQPQASTPTPRTPLPADDALEPPIAPYLAPVSDKPTPRDSYGPSSVNDSLQGLAAEKPTEPYAEDHAPPQRRTSIFKRPVFWLAIVVALVVLILVVVVPVYFTVIKKKSSAATATPTYGGSTPMPSASPTSVITGGDGSIITTETGVSFTYQNPFGGICEYSIHQIPSYTRLKDTTRVNFHHNALEG